MGNQVLDPVGLAEYVRDTLALNTAPVGPMTPTSQPLQAGDYLHITTPSERHGFVVVGWRAIEACPVALTQRHDRDDFFLLYQDALADANQPGSATPYDQDSQGNRLALVVPWVADFTTVQAPIPRPFFCSRYAQNTQTQEFRPHDWYFYTLPNSGTVPLTLVAPDSN